MAVTKEQVRRQLKGLRQLYGDGEKDMTQEAAAHKVGTSTRNWQRWERMKVMPEPENLSLIAEKFEIPLDAFDDGQTGPKRPILLVDRLDRLEGMLWMLLSRTGAPAEEIEAELRAAVEQAQRRAADNGRAEPGQDSTGQ